MHSQILRIWPRGIQALAIETHNLALDNEKRNSFSLNWSDNDAKKNRQQTFYDISLCRVKDKMPKTGTADLIKCSSNVYF